MDRCELRSPVTATPASAYPVRPSSRNRRSAACAWCSPPANSSVGGRRRRRRHRARLPVSERIDGLQVRWIPTIDGGGRQVGQEAVELGAAVLGEWCAPPTPGCRTPTRPARRHSTPPQRCGHPRPAASSDRHARGTSQVVAIHHHCGGVCCERTSHVTGCRSELRSRCCDGRDPPATSTRPSTRKRMVRGVASA